MQDIEQLFSLLKALVEAPGVSGQEAAVAEVAAGFLTSAGYPADAFQADYLGNRWLHLGPAGEPQRLLVAHLDEIGFRITSIREDGICRLKALGGIDAQLWEGTPVAVHTADGPVPGCIAPQSHHVSYRVKSVGSPRLNEQELLLDLGAQSPAAVAELGVRLLDAVTWPKSIQRLVSGIVQARSLDDRFGCCAVCACAAALQQKQLDIPTVFAFSVQEEIGLRGARALASRFSQCSEVIAIDSFAVGTGPRDSKQYDAVQLGKGPALRSWDSTILVPDEVRESLLSKAASLGYQLQYGFMPGGNDASVFEPSGARVFGLTIPVQYSHTAAERVNLHDLARLSSLLADWCQTSLELP